MNKNILVAIILSLVIGGGIGYTIATNKDTNMETPINSTMSTEYGSQNTNQDMASALKDKKGDALDQAFLDGMIVHHQGAIDMAKIVLANSKRPELQKMAQDIISAQSSEITTMKGWLNAWYGR